MSKSKICCALCPPIPPFSPASLSTSSISRAKLCVSRPSSQGSFCVHVCFNMTRPDKSNLFQIGLSSNQPPPRIGPHRGLLLVFAPVLTITLADPVCPIKKCIHLHQLVCGWVICPSLGTFWAPSPALLRHVLRRRGRVPCPQRPRQASLQPPNPGAVGEAAPGALGRGEGRGQRGQEPGLVEGVQVGAQGEGL